MNSPARRKAVWAAFVVTTLLAYFAPGSDAPVQAIERVLPSRDRARPQSTADARPTLLPLRARDGQDVDERFFWTAATAASAPAAAGSAPEAAPSFPYEVSGEFVDGDKTFVLLSHGDKQQAAAVGDTVAQSWHIESAGHGALVVVDTVSGTRQEIAMRESP